MKKAISSALLICGVLIFSQKKTDTLEKSKDIQEVILKAQHKKQFADKAVYTFDKEALEKAKYAKDLLKTLPELQLDPISNTIKSTKGGTILFLINGIEASDMQFRSVQPSEVVRVEYYDIPPAKYSQRADTVVNMVTRNPETGYVFGTDVSTALNTGFVNGSAYANYTKGKNDFGLEYSINLRDYDNRKVKSIYDYQLDNIHYRSEENRKDHFGYTDQNLAFRFTRVIPQKYSLQAKFSTQIFTGFYHTIGQSIFSQNNSDDLHSTFKDSSKNYLTPTLDLYFSKNLGKKDELSLNFVGSNFTTKSSDLAKELVSSTGDLVFDDNTNLKAKQTGIVGELAYTHKFENSSLSSGYRITNNSISNDLQNLIGVSQYNVNYFQQYIYTEYSGKIEKLSYRLGAGLTNIHNKSAENTVDNWTFMPKIILSYPLKNNQNLRFSSSYKPVNPESSALSSNVVQIAPNILQKGNPYLKVAQQFSNNLIYSFNNKYFDFNANLYYQRTKDAFNQYYVKDEILGGYALTYENAENSQQYGLELSGSYKPFGNNLLVIKAFLKPASENIRTKNNVLIKNNYIENDFVISSEYKSFSVQYEFNLPVYTLRGAFLNTNENANHFFATYKHKEFSFYTGMYWIGTPSEYKTKSLPESLVNYYTDRKIYNNKSMFVLGFSYDFSKGKKTKIDKTLNNSTAPAATF